VSQPIGLLGVTVAIRRIPLVTAAYGTRVARPVRTTMACTWWRRLQLIRRVRPVLDDHMPRGQADEGGAQSELASRLGVGKRSSKVSVWPNSGLSSLVVAFPPG
jgi:hypothetical protein